MSKTVWNELMLDAGLALGVDTDWIVAPQQAGSRESQTLLASAAEDISVQAVTAVFSPDSGILTVMGDEAGNSVDFSLGADGSVLVNGGAIPISGGSPTLGNTILIQAFGQGGDDVIRLDETNGALPSATLSGGLGNDTLTGGSGADQLFGDGGNDVLNGRAGDDLLFGGSEDDTLTGGLGDDQLSGDAGNDRLLWNTGDGSDVMEGGDGTDTVQVNAGEDAQAVTVLADGQRVRVTGMDATPASLDIGSTEKLQVNLNGGDDRFDATALPAGITSLSVDGGAGNDTVFGGSGHDFLSGGADNDYIEGNLGNDYADLGSGDDIFGWDVGDGYDSVHGMDGSDTLRFTGSATGEDIGLAGSYGWVRLAYNLNSAWLDLYAVERVDIAALGGEDSIVVNDFYAAGVTQIAIDLAAAAGGSTGDGDVDHVTLRGSGGTDGVTVRTAGEEVLVEGLSAEVRVAHAEGRDVLTVDGQAGNDSINASGLVAGQMSLEINGGLGTDFLTGSQGSDLISGGDGTDFVLMGAGDDVFLWNTGDDADVVQGDLGADRAVFNDNDADQNVEISAYGTSVRLVHDLAGVATILSDVERIDYGAAGGADVIVVNDLSGTAVTHVNVSLAASRYWPHPDVQSDQVIVNATAGDDAIAVGRILDGVRVSGLAAQVDVLGEAASDTMSINAGEGNDVVDASGVAVTDMRLVIGGGGGNDTILGGDGNDRLSGGDGNDFIEGNKGDDHAELGVGDDVYSWGPGDGDDSVHAMAGSDTLHVNGSSSDDSISVSANSASACITHYDYSVVSLITITEVERIEINARAGHDNILIGDLSGSTVRQVAVDLAGDRADGSDEIRADRVTVKGTASGATIRVAMDGDAVLVSGLPAQVRVAHAESGIDQLVLNGGDGDDYIDASRLPGGQIDLQIDGGFGADIILGSQGSDVIRSGRGNDLALMGAGDDVFVWEYAHDSDYIAGQEGFDTLAFTGSYGATILDISADGEDVRMSDLAEVTLTVSGVERIDCLPVGGSDIVLVGDLSSTVVTEVNISLAATPYVTSGDGEADWVIVSGTTGGDSITVAGNAAGVSLSGLAARVNLSKTETIDTLAINAGAGNDTVDASGLAEGAIGLVINGGTGHDTLKGSSGNDQLLGGDGNDLLITAGGVDVLEGGADVDTVVINGGDRGLEWRVASVGDRVSVRSVPESAAGDSLDIGTAEHLVINLGGGQDRIIASGVSAGAVHLTVNSGAGDDTIVGGYGADLLLGGDDNDLIIGGLGDDTVLLGTGDDVFAWFPGEGGSDVVEGQAGIDTLQISGGGLNDSFFISANGERVRISDRLFANDVPTFRMDLNDVEHIDIAAEDGQDLITIDPLVGTDVTHVAIDLAEHFHGSHGDGETDIIVARGTSGGDTIEISVNGTSAAVAGLPALVTIANAESIDELRVGGGAGDDTISAAAIPAGSIHLSVWGGSGNDTIFGGNGGDFLDGGDDNDFIDGNQGDDTAQLGDGNDVFSWDEGDGNDDVLGMTGTDTLRLNGSSSSWEQFNISADGVWDRVSYFGVVGSSIDLSGVERIEITGGDSITVDDLSGSSVREVMIDLTPTPDPRDGYSSVRVHGSAYGNTVSVVMDGDAVLVNGLPAQVRIAHAEDGLLTLDGGEGNDYINASYLPAGQIDLRIYGGLGVDLIMGSQGFDRIVGGDGNDQVYMGAGNDVFEWTHGDDSDYIFGQEGFDTLLFWDGHESGQIEISGGSGYAYLFRDADSAMLSLKDVEVIMCRDVDNVVVNDLSGAGVTAVMVDLGDDPQVPNPDRVTVRGTAAADSIAVTSDADSVSVSGLAARVDVRHGGGEDTLLIDAGAGDDVVDASALPQVVVAVIVDGGTGNDALIGGSGADQFLGGDGDDFVDGDQGNDIALLGIGDDVFVWNAGDGSDHVDGQADHDTLRFSGSGANENVNITGYGFFARLLYKATSMIDLFGMERIDIAALGGADTIVVNDLSGTGVTQVAIDLAATPGGSTGDSRADGVTVGGTAGADMVTLTTAGDEVLVQGLPAEVRIAHAEAGNDRLIINGQGGNDVISAGGLAAGAISLEINGGLGADVIAGSQGDDRITGGDGNDLVFMGGGNDVFVWNAGDDSDSIQGQEGVDTLIFNAGTADQNVEISANGANARLFRDVGGVTMDLNGVEKISFSAGAGADIVVVNDLSGTGVTEIAINLGDSSATKLDRVVVRGTAAGDSLSVAVGDQDEVTVSGLAAQVVVLGANAASDTLSLQAGEGDDVLDASGLAAAAIGLVLDGGAGDDLLIGGAGNDRLVGDSDDVLDGGAGDDVLALDTSSGAALDGELVIRGFQAGAGSEDRVDLSGIAGLSFDWLMDHATTVDGNAVLDLGNGERIKLLQVAAESLHADDFVLA